MGVKNASVIEVGFLTEVEAQSLFHQHCETPDDADLELQEIGEDIVRKCCGLPIAIKTMACTLSGKHRDTWMDAHSRLKHHGINTVGIVADTVFKTSYDYLKDNVTEATFFLCGLFPEDFNIPTEELLRYGWGLNLFKEFGTIREARYRVNTHIERLMHTNLLIKSDMVGCVKMHDLVHDFVLRMFSEVEHSVVNHGSNKPGWPETENDVSVSCKRISLTCKGMTEFPSDLNFPNVSILKLMHGNTSMRFRQGFYERMGNLQVISYDGMKYPFLFSSLECSTNIRVLCLHKCLFAFDLSSIGNLSNLEVLSFVGSSIRSLPSTIGMLKKLRVLDVTNCCDLCIDNDVFKKLHRLEELYASNSNLRFSVPSIKSISFRGDNCNEVAERWKNLSALEYKFFEDNPQWKNLSFEKLERFKISVGPSIEGKYVILQSKHSLENTLKLVTKKDELFKSGINKLFKKTVMLCLSVDDLEDVWLESLLGPQSSSFLNIRVLVVSTCVKLRYLFMPGVAKVLPNLEHLEVSRCHVMKELIHIESDGKETVTFPNLKFLSLSELPELLGLCQNVNRITLPQLVELTVEGIPNITSIYSKNKLERSCLLGEEISIPKLEKLHINDMKDLKKIWPRDFGTSEEVKLREIKVNGCDKLETLFPCNPIPFLYYLEELKVEECDSIEALFNIDLDCVAATEKDSTSLRSIEARDLWKLQEVWRIRGGDNNSGLRIGGFQAVESIKINGCKRFRNVFSPTTTNFDLGALIHLHISYSGNYGLMESSQEQEFSQVDGDSWTLCQYAREIDIWDCDALSSVIPWYAAGQMIKLQMLRIWYCRGMKEVFETQGINRSVITMKLANLKKLDINGCDLLEHIFTFPTLETLVQLEELRIANCQAMKVIVVKAEEQTTMASSSKAPVVKFPRLRSIVLLDLPEMVGFFLGTNIEFQWPSLDYFETNNCPQMKVFTAGGSTAPQLKYVETSLGKHSPVEPWFNSHVTTTTTGQHDLENPCPSSQSRGSLCPAATTSEEINLWSFHNLIELVVKYNSDVKKIIPSNELLRLQKLEMIRVYNCSSVEEVFEALEGTNSTTRSDESQPTHVNLPNLTQVELEELDSLRHIWKSNQWTTFEFPNLITVSITKCHKLEHVFSSSMVGSLLQLQELEISNCKNMKEVFVVEEEKESDGKTNEIVFRCLKYLKLYFLGCLKGFCTGKADFSFPLLDTLTIENCPAIMTFTMENLSTLKLKGIKTGFGSFYVEEGINSFIKMKQEEFNKDGYDDDSDEEGDQDFNVNIISQIIVM